mmetsp:Transcript_57722/g.137368  ORF Transcript_57722/g.137368 Transcript_57722/m.137368 type:complete len:269 (-) Transcript_57722:266-1072(-)
MKGYPHLTTPSSSSLSASASEARVAGEISLTTGITRVAHLIKVEDMTVPEHPPMMEKEEEAKGITTRDRFGGAITEIMRAPRLLSLRRSPQARKSSHQWPLLLHRRSDRPKCRYYSKGYHSQPSNLLSQCSHTTSSHLTHNSHSSSSNNHSIIPSSIPSSTTSSMHHSRWREGHSQDRGTPCSNSRHPRPIMHRGLPVISRAALRLLCMPLCHIGISSSSQIGVPGAIRIGQVEITRSSLVMLVPPGSQDPPILLLTNTPGISGSHHP